MSIVSTEDNSFNLSLPTIFMITPTYARPTQKADLTRLCQTLMHVRNLHWIIIEDSDSRTPLVTRFLKRCQVKSSQLNRKTSSKLQPAKVSAKEHKNRGAEQRNIALDWLRETYKPGDVTGVVYFGDDDNTYDIQLFEEVDDSNFKFCRGIRNFLKPFVLKNCKLFNPRFPTNFGIVQV